jgi:RNA polymerase sigma factor (sigma-70 family)
LFKKISDKNIIEGIRNQDDKTLNWLYENYFYTVKNHVIKNSGTIDDVSDVFQDSIIVLFNQIQADTLSLTSDLKGYFFGIARNIWNAQLRKKRDTVELDDNLPDDLDSDEMISSLLERIVSRAFLKLKPDYQTLLKLYSDGYSFEEIAVKLNLKNEMNARRKKYICKEALMELVKEDTEYQEYLRFRK